MLPISDKHLSRSRNSVDVSLLLDSDSQQGADIEYHIEP